MIKNETVNALRFLSADSVERAQSGHPGMPLGMADIAEVLWRDHFTVWFALTSTGTIIVTLNCWVQVGGAVGLARNSFTIKHFAEVA